MIASQTAVEIQNLPPYVRSWSVASIPGFILSALDNWQRNFGDLPDSFSLVACPHAEVSANGGLTARVIKLTDARTRIKKFTSCHRLYLVILLLGDDAEARRGEIQRFLSWSEGYRVVVDNGVPQLNFVEAIEECEQI